MSGWGVMLAIVASLGGGLVFLSIVSDDLQRVNTDLNNREFKLQEARKERLEYEAAVRKAQAKAETDGVQPSVEASQDADGEDAGEIFTANPSE